MNNTIHSTNSNYTVQGILISYIIIFLCLLGCSINKIENSITGTVKGQNTKKGIQDLHVFVYDKDRLRKDELLGVGVTDAKGKFTIDIDSSTSKFERLVDEDPDLYFIVKDAGLELLNTENEVIKDAKIPTEKIHLLVDLSKDILRKEINKKPVAGWNGKFYKSNPDFAYPTPNLTSLKMPDNLKNMKKLERQQKILWPEFSWESKPGKADPERCYQMFAPDISRVGYTDDGKIYSIICPQQGLVSPHLGALNVEVTVTGTRGWVNEKNKELAADMKVEAKLWFSKEAENNKYVKQFLAYFNKHNLTFPLNKANAIRIATFNPGHPKQPIFPLRKGLSPAFPIPDFAKHEGVSWATGHLGVEIGSVVKGKNKIVNKFNQLIVDVFNIGAGNMLKEGNVLTWNLWFTAPELVNTKEWEDHAELWRHSIDANHGSPNGNRTDARHFDGSAFHPLQEATAEELVKIVGFIKEHL